MSKFAQLKELIAATEADAQKFFENGNAAAGTRVRKALQEVKNLSQEIRNEVTALKNKEK